LEGIVLLSIRHQYLQPGIADLPSGFHSNLDIRCAVGKTGNGPAGGFIGRVR
jgi:hypothetical protein